MQETPAATTTTAAAADQRVRLNVGGRRFEVARATVAAHPDTMLARMFAADGGGAAALAKADADGFHFIDADGDAFAVVLNYMRTRALRCVVPAGMEDHMRAEFSFWGVDGDALLPREDAALDIGARLRNARTAPQTRAAIAVRLGLMTSDFDDTETRAVDEMAALFLDRQMAALEEHAYRNYFAHIYVLMHKHTPADACADGNGEVRESRAVFARAVATTQLYAEWLGRTQTRAAAHARLAGSAPTPSFADDDERARVVRGPPRSRRT